ncbi:hypothetical protein [Arthrobacter sp. VKM Ac-2550]|uniref:hypothetical protein n=1 Tax=Crystallibacter permensis TaxID=1938888 RepID=UPI002226505E|nr:hypothetical protein [Arthrobacter sp. VKM Ac-2550]MCW2132900.1 hypothetical protein [Arthrobacter sp. VKM Ac-2550]
MSITDEAIEAAAVAMFGRQVFGGDVQKAWEGLPQISVAYWRSQARTALRAAAPLLAAQLSRELEMLADP